MLSKGFMAIYSCIRGCDYIPFLYDCHCGVYMPFLSDLGEAAKVPVLSLSVTSPALSNQRFPYFVHMAHSDRIQMKAVAALVKHYGWRSIAFLHSEDDFGSGAMSSLRDALQHLDSDIIYTSMISSTAQKQTIREELYKLKIIESSVFVVHTPCGLGMNLFMEARDIGMMQFQKCLRLLPTRRMDPQRVSSLPFQDMGCRRRLAVGVSENIYRAAVEQLRADWY